MMMIFFSVWPLTFFSKYSSVIIQTIELTVVLIQSEQLLFLDASQYIRTFFNVAVFFGFSTELVRNLLEIAG